MNRQQMIQRIERITDLPTLPTVAMELNRMLQDLDTPVDQLVVFLERDQALVVRILKLVNSSFYGFKSKIASLRHAVSLVGYNTIQNAVISVSIIDSVKLNKTIKGFDIASFWAHSIGVAVMCQHLANQTKLAASEDAFTAGLIHDIGKIVLANSFPNIFKPLLEVATAGGIGFYEAEKASDTYPHNMIGAMLMRRWLLPEQLVDAVRYHHGTNGQDNENMLVGLVSVADVLVKFIEGSATSIPDPDKLHPAIRKQVTPVLMAFSQWLPGVKETISSACEFFNKG